MTSQSSLTRVRLNGLDHLRFLVIVGVVILHASMTFMAYAPEWWYVVDPPGSLAYTLLVLAIDVPIMPILFFLSGYFAWASLVRRGPGPFLRGKALRIGAPWVIGSLLLAPPTAYLALASRGLGDGLAPLVRPLPRRRRRRRRHAPQPLPRSDLPAAPEGAEEPEEAADSSDEDSGADTEMETETD